MIEPCFGMNGHPIPRMDTILRQCEVEVNIYNSRWFPAPIYRSKWSNIACQGSNMKEYPKTFFFERKFLNLLNKIIFEGYRILGLKTFFTAGPKEIRAWTIKNGYSAPNAAGVIHTDFEKGFIKAEVIDFKDFIECNGELKAKEKGKLRLEGKDYIVKDGDIIHFKFNV